MMKRDIISLGLLVILGVMFLAAPVSAGLSITSGEKIMTRTGSTSPVINITGQDIEMGKNITIDITAINGIVANGTFTTANVRVSDTALEATWTGNVEGPFLNLTSTNNATVAGETVTVTLTGALGSAWLWDTGGERTGTVTATRADTGETATFDIVIETALGPGGLTVANGTKIRATNGYTSMKITVTDAPILQYDTIIMDVWPLDAYVSGGSITNANVVVTDTASAATWTGVLEWGTLTLTSNGGPTAVGETVTVTFKSAIGNTWIPDTNGEQVATLTAYRMDTYGTGDFNFVIDTGPSPSLIVAANFTASPASDIAPLTVRFADTSWGHPTSWSWDFDNDGIPDSTDRNPTYTYPAIGTYTVSMTAANAYRSDTKTIWDYIHVLNGAVREANTSINGLTITNCGGPQSVTVDASIVPAALIPNTSVLEVQPPADRGLKNITLYALNGVGFSRVGDLISGNPTGVHLVSEEIAPLAGFSPEIGPLSSFNYSIDLPSYPCNATLSTKIWEGTIPAYDARLLQICSGNVPPAVPIGTAYTAKITRTNIPSAAPVTLHMSVNSAWNGLLSGGPGNVSIWRISDDGTTGQVLQTEYLYSDPVDSLDFFTANTSQGLSTFGLSSLTGGNNPFQLITLTIISVISEPPKLDEINTPTNPAVKSTIPVTLQTPAVPATIPVPADPGKTAKIYANAQGVITQETTLQSTDGLASFTLGLGIAAKDDSGKPLESISITRTPETSLPAAPPGGALSFAGMAYDLQPDGATFSPSIPVSFTVPQAQWGKEFTLQEYDRASGTWQALPSKYDPQTGTITADVSHFCCFGLFAKSVTPSSTPAAVNEPVKAPTKAPVPPPTAMSTFSGMVLWITQNPLVIAGIIILVGVVVFYEQKKRRLNKRF